MSNYYRCDNLERDRCKNTNVWKNWFGLSVSAVFIAFDRLEKNDEGIQASQAFSEKTGIPVHAIITIYDVLSLLKEDSFKDTDQVPESSVEEIESYLKIYSN